MDRWDDDDDNDDEALPAATLKDEEEEKDLPSSLPGRPDADDDDDDEEPSGGGGRRRRRRVPLFDGCRSVDEFERLDRIDEGSYGVVYRARDNETKEVVALKRVKLTRESCAEGFPITALRETNVLLALSRCEHVVSVKEMVVGREFDKVFMVMEYFDHDLKTCVEKHDGPFPQGDVKSLFVQLLAGVEYLHSKWFMHRDIKTSNLLYQNRTGRLALADFGLARRFGDPPPKKESHRDQQYTRNVVTLWYRCPELLLGATTYAGPDVDMWSVGCVFAELLLRRSLFNAKTELEQISQIFGLLGLPTEDRWPGFKDLPIAQTFKFKAQKRNKLRESLPTTGFTASRLTGNASTPLSETGLDLANALLNLDPKQRASAAQARDHPYFSEAPLPTPRHLMPKFQLDRL